MTKSENLKKFILLCIITVLAITWTGIGYIKWFYGLFESFAPEFLDISGNVIDYGLQAIGVLLFILYIKCRPYTLRTAMFFVIAAELVSMIGATLIPVAPVKLALGYVMVIFIGMLTGGYITLLATLLADCGLVYGIAAALGGIVSWLITLPLGGDLYLGSVSTAVYAAIAVALIALIWSVMPSGDDKSNEDGQTGTIKAGGQDLGLIVHGMLLLLIVCVTMNMGYYFPVSDLAGGGVSLEVVRATSAAGLLIAGIVVTKSRQSGLILCICALLSPFLSMALSQDPTLKLPVYILSYILMGVYGVYCVVLFVDISKEYGMYLAAAGMMIRRAGESLGNGVAILISQRPMVLVVCAGILFVGAIFIAAAFWRRMYNSFPDRIPAQTADGRIKSEEERFAEFVTHFDISDREQDVLRQVMEGKTNAEAAAALFISENTVKFHIKNILKKTGATNRKELRRIWIDRSEL